MGVLRRFSEPEERQTMQTGAGWKLGGSEPISGPQKWVWGNAGAYFLGEGQGDDSCRNHEGSQTGQSLGPEASHALGMRGGDAGRAGDQVAQTPGQSSSWGEGWGLGKGGWRREVQVGLSRGRPLLCLPLSRWPPSSLFDASHHRLQTGCPVLPPPSIIRASRSLPSLL